MVKCFANLHVICTCWQSLLEQLLALVGHSWGFLQLRSCLQKLLSFLWIRHFFPKYEFISYVVSLSAWWLVLPPFQCWVSNIFLMLWKQSEYEREMCARTVYCTNIDKKVQNTSNHSYCSTLVCPGYCHDTFSICVVELFNSCSVRRFLKLMSRPSSKQDVARSNGSLSGNFLDASLSTTD